MPAASADHRGVGMPASAADRLGRLSDCQRWREAILVKRQQVIWADRETGDIGGEEPTR
jgi:hypothetical protein